VNAGGNPREAWPERRRRILEVVRDVPEGSVVSYGQVAALAGIPRGARQVGRALAEAPADEPLPWHRVLRANGATAFPEGSAGYARQRDRLRAEGVIMSKGQVDMRRYRWQPDLDELLWKPSAKWD